MQGRVVSENLSGTFGFGLGAELDENTGDFLVLASAERGLLSLDIRDQALQL
jgi:hypothetical protein